MGVILKPFSTLYGKYVYDRETNSILLVTNKEYESFERIYNVKATEGDIKILKEFQEKGFFRESILKNVVHPFI